MPRRRKVDASTSSELLQGVFYGPEPGLEKDLGKQLDWYNACATDKDAIEWLTEYLEIIDRHEDAQKVKRVHEQWTPRTSGWLARLALRGYTLTDHNRDHIENQLARSFKHGLKDEPKELAPRSKPNVQEHITEKASDIVGELEGMVDDNNVSGIFDFLKSRQISAIVAGKALTKFEGRVSELVGLFELDEKQLLDVYGTAKHAEETAVAYQGVVDALQSYLGVAKTFRKPRKRKPVSTEKLLQHFRYAKKHGNLESIDPAKILGKTELWTFNTKNNILSVFRAADTDGLKIRRSMIVNIDERTSMAKRIGRKTEERLETVLTGGKVALRKLMETITGEALTVKRINDETILLRVL